jgi:hypothetical protein
LKKWKDRVSPYETLELSLRYGAFVVTSNVLHIFDMENKTRESYIRRLLPHGHGRKQFEQQNPVLWQESLSLKT